MFYTDIRQHFLWWMGGEYCFTATDARTLMTYLLLGLGLGSVVLRADQSQL